ncbi:MAG: multidrug ABC transporter ATPase [Solibacillus sp.]
MQTNNRKKKSEPALDNIPVSQAASLEVIAGLFATLAEGLGTFAAALAIQETEQQTNANNADLQKIHEQLHYLTKEVKKISRALNIS